MSHEITATDKVLSVREPTWHGLEEYRDDYLSLEETKKLVHDWDVVREPVYRRVVSIDENGPTHTYELINEFELNTRTDNAAELAIVPTERVDVSIQEMYDIVEVLQGQGAPVLIETAGSLRGGRDVWIMLKLNEPIEIKGDPNGASIPYFALQNSYQVGQAFRGQAINLRIVCANTSRAADLASERNGMNFAFAHTSNMLERVEEAKQALAGWRENVQQWKLAKEHLALQPVTIAGINRFVNAFIPEPHHSLITDLVKDNIDRSRLELIGEIFSPMNEGIELTALGLFEGASSYVEHVRKAQTPLSRFKRSVLEPSSLLAEAYQLTTVL